MAHIPRQPRGYHKVARLMSNDGNIAIFRRFSEANILNLLYLQAEVMDLQANLQFQSNFDDDLGTYERDFSTEFKRLREAGNDSDQYMLMEALSKKLKEYNQALVHYQQITTFPNPRVSQLNTLRDWLQDPLGGRNFLKGGEAATWEEDTSQSSFVKLSSSSGEDDIFSRFVGWLLTTALGRWCCGCSSFGRVIDVQSQLTSFSDTKINTVCAVLSTIISSLLPVLTILVLYYVKNDVARICITLGFTAVFAAVLALFSNARRVEIFAATATFAAVEVVFIGSALGH